MRFSDIKGNKEVIARLKHLADTDKMPHALLLWGEPGIGKLAVARAFAQYIHCTNKINGDACGECPNCIQHQTFNHPDTFFVFPVIKKKNAKTAVSDDYIDKWKDFLQKYEYESYARWQKILENENSQPKIFVHESANILHKMSLASFSSKFKIMIMWLPEKMNEDCANKLLKLIEEPFPDSLFILVSDNPKELLPTIYSRTQRIELKRLSNQDIASFLEEKYNIEYQDAVAIAATVEGDMVAAEESLMLDSENKEFFDFFVQVMRMAYQRDIKGLKTWAEKVNDFKREKEQRFMKYCARMLRENFIYNIGDRDLNYLTRAEEQFSSKFAPFINERNVSQMFNEFILADNDIQRNANAKIVLFDLALKITKLIRK